MKRMKKSSLLLMFQDCLQAGKKQVVLPPSSRPNLPETTPEPEEDIRPAPETCCRSSTLVFFWFCPSVVSKTKAERGGRGFCWAHGPDTALGP